VAYNLPYVVRSARATAPISGTTTSAAAAAGVPAAIAEVGGRGLLEEDAVQRHLDGLDNALRHLGMLPGDPCPPRSDMRSVGRFVWLRCEDEGWWEPAVSPGEAVAEGQLLGTVSSLDGARLLQTITAPAAGVPMFITSSPAVAADGLLLGLGAA
jgi:predicted deacylase